MSKKLTVKKLFLFMAAAGMVKISTPVFASGFQLWESDAVNIGDYHAGNAAIADDASTSFNNPAGLIKIPQQQLIAGGSAILTNFKFDGTVQTSIPGFPAPVQPTVSQGGGFNFVPFFHYSSPFNEKTAFGFSVVVPFGLKTDYGISSLVRYSAMLSSIKVIDYAPAIAYAFNSKWSLGLGLDIEHMYGEFTQMTTLDAETSEFDTLSHNKGSDTAYGYHAGVLYQPTEKTRWGVVYHSQVVHHLKGDSTYTGFIADAEGVPPSDSLRSRITLPPVTTLSFFS